MGHSRELSRCSCGGNGYWADWMAFDDVWRDLDGNASKDMYVGIVAHGKESRTDADGD